METIILIVLGFIVGWKLSEWITTASFMKILDDLGVSNDQLSKLNDQYAANLGIDEKPAEEAAEKIVNVKIEQHGNRLYAYDLHTDEFLVYADTAEELITALSQRYDGNTRVLIEKDQGGQLVESAVKDFKPAA
jgi:hypothetical protein